jgi:indole-3-glycerol phosphate synthase
LSDFLDRMATGSEARWRAAEALEPFEALRRRALATPAPRPLRLHGGFDLIAEVKLVAPSAGRLAEPPPDRAGFVVDQARAYARGGAASISVLTEPSRFDGRLDDLVAVAAAVDVPAMRKDFLVHPYQVWEARAAGAGGVLLIARLLDGDQLDGMLAAAREAGLFVLLEAFDVDDVAAAVRVAGQWKADAPPLLVGVNTRDLATLQVAPGRLEELAPALPPQVPAVAESGLVTEHDVRRVKGLGYTVALVGSALMRADDPAAAAELLLLAGRA